MVQPNPITFYTNTFSPYSRRVQIALNDAKAEYTSYSYYPPDRPSWYLEKVNPKGKIPVITYGGPITSPEDPSPQSAKLTESLVITEFIAEAFPESGLHPTDLVQRARARVFISVFEAKTWEYTMAFLRGTGSFAPVSDKLKELQALLPAETGFAVGEWSLADVAVAPFLVPLKGMLRNGVGSFALGDGEKAWETLNGPEFVRLMRYVEDLQRWPSFEASYDEVKNLEMWKSYLSRNQGSR